MDNIEFECPVCHVKRNSRGEPFLIVRAVALHIAGKINTNCTLHKSWACTKIIREEIDKARGRINVLADLLEWHIQELHDKEDEVERICRANKFDLGNLNRLINSNKPVSILLADTNVVMNYPDFNMWSASRSDVIYVLPGSIIYELESLKSKKKEETQIKARNAINAIHNFYKQGYISKGIYLKDVGWFISIPTPDNSESESVLSGKSDMKTHFGRSDAQLLLLAKELYQNIPHILTVVVTADKNLYNLFSAEGIISHAGGFPLNVNKYIDEYTRGKDIDWDDTLSQILSETEEIDI